MVTRDHFAKYSAQDLVTILFYNVVFLVLKNLVTHLAFFKSHLVNDAYWDVPESNILMSKFGYLSF